MTNPTKLTARELFDSKMCPLEELADYAEDHGIGPEIAEGFRTVEAAADPIVYNGPALIDDFLDELKRQAGPDKDLRRS
jgi:hypothetical protein